MSIAGTIGGGLHVYLFANTFQTFLMPTRHRMCFNAIGAFLGSTASVATYNILGSTQIQRVAGVASLTTLAMIEVPMLYNGLFIDLSFLPPIFWLYFCRSSGCVA